jgi:hypothetical protein
VPPQRIVLRGFVECRQKDRELHVDQIHVRDAEYDVSIENGAAVEHVIDHVKERRL